MVTFTTHRHPRHHFPSFEILIAALISLAIWGGLRAYAANVSYPRMVGGHLKRAADANTIELAHNELAIAIGNMEDLGMTEGNTAVFWPTPARDVGFWYQNLNAALNELRNLPKDSTALERTNVLMKLRETITDDGEKGTVITQPDGISIFPYNKEYFWWVVISAIVGAIAWFRYDNNSYY